MDLYEALISGAPNQAQIPEIVEQLRKRKLMGSIGALTGDKVLSPFGQDMSRGADQSAEQLQGIRQKDADNAQTAKYQNAQIDHQGKVLAQTIARDNANAAHQRAMAAAAQRRAEAAMAASQKKTQPKPMNNQAMNTVLEAKQKYDKVNNLVTSFKDDYARLSVPGARLLHNTLARVGIGSEEDKAAFEWWRTFKSDYEMLARNESFGATLSPQEKAAWQKSTAGEEMDAEQVKTVLKSIDRWYGQSLQNTVDTYSMTYNPEQVAKAGGRAATAEAPGPSEEDYNDFFTAYDEDPEAASAAWEEAFPGIPNPAETPAQ